VDARPGGRGVADGPGSEEVGEVREGVADGGHFPVEDTDYAGLGGVEDEVVDFVVAVDEYRAAFAGLVAGEEGEELVEVRGVADGEGGVGVAGCGLGGGEAGEGGELAGVEARGLAEGLEADF